MKRAVIAACVAATLSAMSLFAAQTSQEGSNLGSVQGGDFKSARDIIEKKCTRCHSSKRIDAALSARKDMPAIQREMERRGAGLNAKEREVLGIYWRLNPLMLKK